MAVLELRDIEKSYGRIKALNGISLEVPEGSVFGILGPNGSGKTTLLSIVLDVLAADKGSFTWMGQASGKAQRRQIGSLLETPNFYHYLSAVDNLKITQSISGRGTEADIDRALQTVKLYERRKSRFSTYSLGMKQRLAIAAALLGDPKILVLDEPTNGLDPVGIAEIRELIKMLNRQGHTIIMASHLLDEVERICTHVTILKTGNILATGSVDEVLADEDTVEVSAKDLNGLKATLEGYPGLIQLRQEGRSLVLTFAKNCADTAALNRHCYEKGYVLDQLILRRKKLETRFFELTNN